MADEQDSRKVADDFEAEDALDYEDGLDEDGVAPSEVPAEVPAEEPAVEPVVEPAVEPSVEPAEEPAGSNEEASVVVPDEAIVPEKPVAPIAEEYDDDEPIEDYVVKLVVNEEPEQSTSARDLIDAVITDTNGHLIPSKTSDILDALDSYTSTVVSEIAGETTAITDGGKSWWSGPTRNYIIFGLIGLCILGLLIAVICLLLRRKSGGNKRAASGSTTTTQNVVNKNVAPDQKMYQRVPNV